MRLLIGLTLLILAGCLRIGGAPEARSTPEPPWPGAPHAAADWTDAPRTVLAAGLRWTFAPGNLTGRAGDVVPFSVDVRPEAAASMNGTVRVRAGAWLRLDNATDSGTLDLPLNGGRFTGTALVGPTDAVRLHTGDQPAFDGARIGLRPAEGDRAVATESWRDASAYPAGLTARREPERVVAVYALRSSLDTDCSNAARPYGNATLRADGVLVGFIGEHYGDDCSGPVLPHTPRVVAIAADAPANLRVVMHMSTSCFCPPETGWRTVTTLAE